MSNFFSSENNASLADCNKAHLNAMKRERGQVTDAELKAKAAVDAAFNPNPHGKADTTKPKPVIPPKGKRAAKGKGKGKK